MIALAEGFVLATQKSLQTRAHSFFQNLHFPPAEKSTLWLQSPNNILASSKKISRGGFAKFFAWASSLWRHNP